MRTLSDTEIKQKELEILLHFDSFCRNHALCYSLCGGTLLGAIRHKGFIPWDDDIDVMMPRPDYERFIQIWRDTGVFNLRSFRLNNLLLPFSKIVNTKTHVKSIIDDGTINKNLWIDIFPIDGLPDNEHATKMIYLKTILLRRLLFLSSARLGEGQTIFRKYSKYILKPVINLYGRRRLVESIEKLACRYPYKNTKFVGSIAWGQHTGEKLPRFFFEKIVFVDFMGCKLPSISNGERYLTQLYGDYMSLPPRALRKTHQMVVTIE